MSFKKTCSKSGEATKNVEKNEIKQMIKMGAEIMNPSDMPKGIDILNCHQF